jgi:hypothetical protein
MDVEDPKLTASGKCEEFNVFERLFLLNGVLPPAGNYTELKIIGRLKDELSFSEEEHEKYEIKVQPNGRLSVTTNEVLLAEKKAIVCGKRAKEIIVNGLKELNRKKQLNPGHIILYERFVGAEDTED